MKYLLAVLAVIALGALSVAKSLPNQQQLDDITNRVKYRCAVSGGENC